MKVLVTGAAGFIGSHTVDRLLARGIAVRGLDNFDPQVHRGPEADTPRHLQGHVGDPNFEFVKGDVRNVGLMREAVDGVDAVLHLASAVGVAQSMYRPEYFADVNVRGTAALLDVLANSDHRVERVVLGSSMTLYGEGAYRTPEGEIVAAGRRDVSRLEAGDYGVYDEQGRELTPAPTPESHPLDPTSVYASTKRAQEELLALFDDAYGLSTVVLRYFNVYGPRQALGNPYTGVAAIFISRFLSGRRPIVFEDGGQLRDFVHVGDVALANVLALTEPDAAGQVLNVGTGVGVSVLEMAAAIAKALDKEHIRPDVQNKYRPGDTRHCIADISRIRTLGYEPGISFAEGVVDLINWASEEKDVEDLADEALAELDDHGLVR